MCPGMKAACAAAAEPAQGSAAEKGEVLRLLARRHCLEKGSVCGPYSKAEAALVVKGDVALAIVLESQQQDREREAAQQHCGISMDLPLRGHHSMQHMHSVASPAKARWGSCSRASLWDVSIVQRGSAEAVPERP